MTNHARARDRQIARTMLRGPQNRNRVVYPTTGAPFLATAVDHACQRCGHVVCSCMRHEDPVVEQAKREAAEVPLLGSASPFRSGEIVRVVRGHMSHGIATGDVVQVLGLDDEGFVTLDKPCPLCRVTQSSGCGGWDASRFTRFTAERSAAAQPKGEAGKRVFEWRASATCASATCSSDAVIDGLHVWVGHNRGAYVEPASGGGRLADCPDDIDGPFGDPAARAKRFAWAERELNRLLDERERA